MAAVTEFQVFHGVGPGTPSDVTNVTMRMKRADNDTQDDSDPVPIPTSGFSYSWRKSFKLSAPVTGPDNSLENLRFFTLAQNMGTGREVFVLFPSAYTQASVSDESSAISADNIDNYTTGSPKVINGGQVLGPAATGTGTQDFVVVQLRQDSTAIIGDNLNDKEIVYRYDEK